MTKPHYIEYQDKVISSHHLLMALLDVAKQRQIHPDKLLKGSRLFSQELEKTELHVDYSQMMRVISNLRKLSPLQDVSFMVGKRLFPNYIGALASPLLNCRNATDLLRLAFKYQQHLFPTVVGKVKRHQGRIYLLPQLTMQLSGDEEGRFLFEVWLGMLVSVIKWRFGYLPKLTFEFDFPAPEYAEQYYANLGGEIHFDRPLTLVAFSQHHLSTPFTQSNVNIMRQQLKGMSNISRKSLLVMLMEGVETGKIHTQDEACQLLELSPATLKRKLKQFDCSFQAIMDEIKRQQAVFDIVVVGCNNEEVAAHTDYNDLTNFRRAFKRWTGMTPSKLRQIYL